MEFSNKINNFLVEFSLGNWPTVRTTHPLTDQCECGCQNVHQLHFHVGPSATCREKQQFARFNQTFHREEGQTAENQGSVTARFGTMLQVQLFVRHFAHPMEKLEFFKINILNLKF